MPGTATFVSLKYGQAGATLDPVVLPNLVAGFGSTAGAFVVSSAPNAMYSFDFGPGSTILVEVRLTRPATLDSESFVSWEVRRRKMATEGVYSIVGASTLFSSQFFQSPTVGPELQDVTSFFTVPSIQDPDYGNLRYGYHEFQLILTRQNGTQEVIPFSVNPPSPFFAEFLEVGAGPRTYAPGEPIFVQAPEKLTFRFEAWHAAYGISKTDISVEKSEGGTGLWEPVYAYKLAEYNDSWRTVGTYIFSNIDAPLSRGTKYRIRFFPTENTGFYPPAQALQTPSYSPEITVNPRTPPTIVLVSDIDGQTFDFGEAVQVDAQITDTDEEITQVYLEYKHPAAPDWIRVPMTRVP